MKNYNDKNKIFLRKDFHNAGTTNEKGESFEDGV